MHTFLAPRNNDSSISMKCLEFSIVQNFKSFPQKQTLRRGFVCKNVVKEMLLSSVRECGGGEGWGGRNRIGKVEERNQPTEHFQAKSQPQLNLEWSSGA